MQQACHHNTGPLFHEFSKCTEMSEKVRCKNSLSNTKIKENKPFTLFITPRQKAQIKLTPKSE